MTSSTVQTSTEPVLLDDLPTVVRGPGEYETRDGRRVQIREISGNATFSAKGAVYKEFRGRIVPRGYDIWHVSGRYRAVGEHPLDIVSVANFS